MHRNCEQYWFVSLVSDCRFMTTRTSLDEHEQGRARQKSKMTKGFGKKNIRKFRLVPSEEGSEQRTLVEVTPGLKSASEEETIDVETVDDRPAFSPSVTALGNPQVGESAKYGIYYDDRVYDYTKHLKPIGVTPGAVYVGAKIKTIVEDEEGVRGRTRHDPSRPC